MDNMLAIEAPGDTSVIVTDSAELLLSAQGLVIANDAQLKQANEWLRDAATLKKKAIEHYAKSKEMAHKLHQQICADEKELQRTPILIDAVLRPKVLTYQRQEREKANAIAEKARQEAHRLEEEARLAKAVALEAVGLPEVAEAVLEAPMPPPRSVAYYAPPPVKLEGTATTTALKFRVTDPDAVGRAWCSVDDAKIRAQIKMSGLKAAGIIGGVEVFAEESLAVKARK